MIINKIKNVLNFGKELPSWYSRNPQMDARLLKEKYGTPEYVFARDGNRYLYFDYVANMDFTLMRQMGLKPKLHYSKYRFPGEWVCRVPVSGEVSQSALAVIAELKNMAENNGSEINESREEYEKYISRYKSAFFEKKR